MSQRGGTRGKTTIIYEDAISLPGYDPIRFEVIEEESIQAGFFYLSKTIKSTLSYQNHWTIPLKIIDLVTWYIKNTISCIYQTKTPWKIITGSSGGCLLTNSLEDANKARKWSTQSRENAAWYQHEEVGYNYRMSNVIAGVIRGQYEYLEEHIDQKKKVYERYAEGLKGLPIKMNPIVEGTEPNYWLSAMIIDEDAMCKQVRGECDVAYVKEAGKTCPTEILEAISCINAEGRPIWKPMHMQPMYRMHEIVGRDGSLRCRTNAYIAGGCEDVGADVFQRGVCLPSDNKMTVEEQDMIIEVIRGCFE